MGLQKQNQSGMHIMEDCWVGADGWIVWRGGGGGKERGEEGVEGGGKGDVAVAGLVCW